MAATVAKHRKATDLMWVEEKKGLNCANGGCELAQAGTGSVGQEECFGEQVLPLVYRSRRERDPRKPTDSSVEWEAGDHRCSSPGQCVRERGRDITVCFRPA